MYNIGMAGRAPVFSPPCVSNVCNKMSDTPVGINTTAFHYLGDSILGPNLGFSELHLII